MNAELELKDATLAAFIQSPQDVPWFEPLAVNAGTLMVCDEIGSLLRLLREQVVHGVIFENAPDEPALSRLCHAMRDVSPDVAMVLATGGSPAEVSPVLRQAGVDWAFSDRLAPSAVAETLTRVLRDHHTNHEAKASLKRLKSDFAVANRRLSKLGRRQKELVHELSTPIAIIQGFSSNMLGGIDGDLTEGQRSHLERIQIACQLLTSLVDQVRGDIEDISASKIPESSGEARAAQRRQFRLPLLVEHVVALVESSYAQKKVDLRVVSDAHCVPVWGEWTRLVQLLVNLLNNALRHTPEGGHVTISTRPEFAISREKKKDREDLEVTPRKGCRLTVEDSGPGIDAANFDAIFLPGWTRSPDPSEKRAGLGLAICSEVAREHGAQLWVESAPGRGAVFHLNLPLDPRKRVHALTVGVVDDVALGGQLLMELRQRIARPVEVIRHHNMEDLADTLLSDTRALVFLGSIEEGLAGALKQLEDKPMKEPR